MAAGAQNRVRLFDTLSNLVTEVERQDDFCRAIINKLNAQSFDAVFQQKYDFYADIFEYLIKDYNKDSGQFRHVGIDSGRADRGGELYCLHPGHQPEVQ